jgi:tRNA(fMet)-specific endonuclease VapC
LTGRYLLDTNILSDVIRNPRGPAARRIRQVGASQVCTSIVVAAELHYGSAKRQARNLALRVAETLHSLDILPLEVPVDAIYAELRLQLERAGNLIGPNDLLIAAQVLSRGLILVTDNEREFCRVPGLPIENWLCLPVE